jgi:hypothetical protein
MTQSFRNNIWSLMNTKESQMSDGIPFSKVRNYGLKKYNMDITFKILKKFQNFLLCFMKDFREFQTF